MRRNERRGLQYFTGCNFFASAIAGTAYLSIIWRTSLDMEACRASIGRMDEPRRAERAYALDPQASMNDEGNEFGRHHCLRP